MEKWYIPSIKKLYDWTLSAAAHPNGLVFLCAIAFIESSFFPIPPDLFLIPLILSRRTDAYKIALYTTFSSVLGGIFGYGIGLFLYDSIGIKILNFYHYTDQFNKFCSYYNTWGAWIVFGAGLTPFPYKIVTIASGVTHLNFNIFVISSLVARGLRFYFIAWLLKKYGSPIKAFIEKNLGWLSVLFFLLLIGGFIILKYL